MQGIFKITLESNPANKDLMRDIELKLLGLQLNEQVTYLDTDYNQGDSSLEKNFRKVNKIISIN